MIVTGMALSLDPTSGCLRIRRTRRDVNWTYDHHKLSPMALNLWDNRSIQLWGLVEKKSSWLSRVKPKTNRILGMKPSRILFRMSLQFWNSTTTNFNVWNLAPATGTEENEAVYNCYESSDAGQKWVTLTRDGPGEWDLEVNKKINSISSMQKRRKSQLAHRWSNYQEVISAEGRIELPSSISQERTDNL
jgi:hypothetical protein